jgi:hypothetical protein
MKISVIALTASTMIAMPTLAAETLTRGAGATANLPALETPVTRSVVQTGRTVTGTSNGMSWTASNRIVGGTPTSGTTPATTPPFNDTGGGNPIFKPSSNKSGVVALIMQTPDGAFICSGSLLGSGRHIATAAHCVTDNFGKLNATRTTAFFFDGDPDVRTPFGPGTSIDVQHYKIAPGYTGEVIDQNDIAILTLESFAPTQFERYELFLPTSLTGANVNIAGYGQRSTVGGAEGTTPAQNAGRTGYLREGDNIFDYAWGNPLFQGFFTTRDVGGQFDGQNFFGFAEVEFSYISDFDNGLRAQSAARRLANGLGLGLIGNANFDDNGVGAREIGVAGGDSGGPGFVNGRLASINSYGLTFGAGFGDFKTGLNNSWGEFSGYVPIYIHADWINSVVPEPGSWAMMIAGFGLVGGTMRRQRKVAATA